MPLPRRSSDYALQTSRNRLKRSDRLALGFAMTAADVPGSAVADDDDSNPPSDKKSSRRKHKGKSREHTHRRSDDVGHPKSYSESGFDAAFPPRQGLRRSGSSVSAKRGGRSTPSPGSRWSSSLWGLGSWLDRPLTAGAASSGFGVTGSGGRRTASSTSSAKWDYPPGDSIEGQGGEGGDDGEESDSSSCSSCSSRSSHEDDAPVHRRPSAIELPGRLLFANRIFTPFQHPSLSASVPNLPSEIGVSPVGTTGLGGMEDVDTVDFEGGESESEDELDPARPGADLLGAPKAAGDGSSVPTPVAPTAVPLSADDPVHRKPQRSATVSPITTPRKEVGDADATESSSAKNARTGKSSEVKDYFGPRAVEREQQRSARAEKATSSTKPDSAEGSQEKTAPDAGHDEAAKSATQSSPAATASGKREERQISAPLPSVPQADRRDSDADAASKRSPRMSLDGPPPSYEAATGAEGASLDQSNRAVVDEKGSRDSATPSPSSVTPPSTLNARRQPSSSASASSAPSNSGSSSSTTPRRPAGSGSLLRRFLAMLKRAIVAVLLAPYEAVTLVFDVGKGRRRRKIEVKLDGSEASRAEDSSSAEPSGSPAVPKTAEARKSGSRSSLVFADKTKQGGPMSEKLRPPTPKPPQRRKGDETPEEKSSSDAASDAIDDDVVTEEQAQQREEARKAREAREKGAAKEAQAESVSTLKSVVGKASKLLPNPHPVDPMLVHEPKAKKVTGEIPEEIVQKRERGASIALVKQLREGAAGTDGPPSPTVSEKDAIAKSGKSPGATRAGSGTPPVPRSAVIHHTPKILVLDLDETLIHSTSRSPTWTTLRAQHSLNGSRNSSEAARNAVSTGGSLLGLEGLGGLLGLGLPGSSSKGRSVRPHQVEVVLDGRSVIYHVYKRPFVDYFLRRVAAWYHVVVFTASVQEYADPVIDWLDQGRGLIAGRLFRDACTYRNGSYLKELTIVDSDLSRVCLVDNSPASYHLNPANGIPIEGWTHDPSDEALLDLLPILDSLRFAQDVRHVLGLRIT